MLIDCSVPNDRRHMPILLLRWSVFVALCLWLSGTACVDVKPVSCSQDQPCPDGVPCQGGVCTKPGQDGGSQRQIPPPGDPSKLPGALANSCELGTGPRMKKQCPKGYFCRGTTCLPMNQYKTSFCERFHAALRKGSTGVCQSSIKCFYDDDSGCSSERKSKIDAYFACLEKQDPCKDPNLGFLKTCSQKTIGTTSRIPGCHYFVELIDQTKSIEFVGGSVACDAYHAKGASGSMPFRVLLGDEQGHPVHLGALLQQPHAVTGSNFQVVQTKVFDPMTGEAISGATVQITIAPAIKAHVTPAVPPAPGDLGVPPQALQLLIDMSEDAANRDSSSTRTSVPAGWVLEQSSGNVETSFLSILLLSGLSFADSRQLDIQTQANKVGALFPLESKQAEEFSTALIKTTNAQAKTHVPLYDGIAKSIDQLREFKEKHKKPHTPQIIALSVAPDASVTAKSGNPKVWELAKLQQELRGAKPGDLLPFVAIVAPPNRDSGQDQATTLAQWDAHQQALCALAQTKAAGGGVALGHVLTPLPHPRYKAFSNQVLRQQLSLATTASGGYIEMSVQFQLTGVTPGQRVAIGVTLQANYNGGKSQKNVPIVFHVTP